MTMPWTRTVDLMPPAFHEGLDDWSRGDGTPETPTYEAAPDAFLVEGDPDFGACLELHKIEATQRLRYMGEVPRWRGGYLEIRARVKLMAGPAPLARVAAWPGGAGGHRVEAMAEAGPLSRLRVRGMVSELRLVIGPEEARGVDLRWDARVLYAHVGLDLLGPRGAVLRIDRIMLRDVTGDFARRGAVHPLPGFAEEAQPIRK